MKSLKELRPKLRTYVEQGQHHGDPYGWLIACKRGHVGMWGPDRIVCSLDVKSPATRKKLSAAGFTLEQDGDDGSNWVGPLDKLNLACRIMGARRKRPGGTISPEARQKGQEALARKRSTHVA